jgi:protein TonB
MDAYRMSKDIFHRSMKRNVIIAISVVAFHIVALWALQTGLRRRTDEVIVPVEILSEFIAPQAPKVMPPPLPARPVPVKQSVAKVPARLQTPAPQPLAIADSAPSPNAPVGITTPAPGATTGTASAAATPPAPARLEQPTSDADYLQNPAPPYPALSKRLGEQGKVVVGVLIGVDGNAQKAEIKQSSGFDRLDQAALGTVLHWRYVPGKRAGVPEAMWFNVPINFVLK